MELILRNTACIFHLLFHFLQTLKMACHIYWILAHLLRLFHGQASNTIVFWRNSEEIALGGHIAYWSAYFQAQILKLPFLAAAHQ